MQKYNIVIIGYKIFNLQFLSLVKINLILCMADY